MRVRITESARADLRHIGDNLSAQGASNVPAFLRRMRAKAISIGDMPLAFRVVKRAGGYEIRRRPFGDYLIFYVVQADVVRVVHIVHGARDVDPALLPGFKIPPGEG